MSEKDHIQEKYIVKLFNDLKKNDDVCTSEDIYFISKNHAPYDFKDQDECDLFLKDLISEKKIDEKYVIFDEINYPKIPSGKRIFIKDINYILIDTKKEDALVKFYLKRTSDSKEFILCLDYNTKNLYFEGNEKDIFKFDKIKFE